jgi:pimeloyl-ACP methyl ester carboxylesterase
VVELAEARTVYYRAAIGLTRQDGSHIGPYLLSLSAGSGGFAPALDLALFRRICPVIRYLKGRNRRAGVFCPLSPQSFAEPEVLDEMVRFLQANKDAAASMVIDITQPALVIRGSKDPIVPQDWAEEVTRRLPRGRLLVIPGGAHTMVTVAALELARVARPFLLETAQAHPYRMESVA